MKIATYNVNGVNGRLPVLSKWLQEAQPDVVCLQELKSPDEKFPVDAIKDLGYDAIWHGQKSYNGVAILAKNRNIEEVTKTLPGDDNDTQSRYIEAVIDGITIGCLYLPNGNPVGTEKFTYKMEWFERLRKHAATLLKTDTPTILVGDFNVIPSEKDVYKPERWVDDALFKTEVRDEFNKLLRQGWTDAIRYLHPDEVIYTFWDYFRNAYGRNAGLRIDHFLLSEHLLTRLINAEVDKHVRGWDKSSDHTPVWIEVSE